MEWEIAVIKAKVSELYGAEQVREGTQEKKE